MSTPPNEFTSEYLAARAAFFLKTNDAAIQAMLMQPVTQLAILQIQAMLEGFDRDFAKLMEVGREGDGLVVKPTPATTALLLSVQRQVRKATIKEIRCENGVWLYDSVDHVPSTSVIPWLNRFERDEEFDDNGEPLVGWEYVNHETHSINAQITIRKRVPIAEQRKRASQRSPLVGCGE